MISERKLWKVGILFSSSCVLVTLRESSLYVVQC
jgi:hypothetical protein